MLAILIIAACALILLSEVSGTWGLAVIIASLASLKWLYFVDVVGIAKSIKAEDIFFGGGIYLVIGAIWTVFKWTLFVHRKKREAADILKDKSTSEWRRDELVKPPQVDKYLGDLVRWMTYWPFSMVFSLFNDIISNVCEFLISYIKEELQRISNRAFKGLA